MPGNDVEIVVGARDSSAPALDALRARLKEVRDAARNAGGNIQLSTDYGRAQADLLIKRVEEVKRKVADLSGAKVRMDTSEFTRQTGLISLRMERLNKLIARPRIDMEGVAKALADMAAIDAAVGRVNAQNKRVGFFTRTSTWGGLGGMLKGMIPGLGGAGAAAGAGAAGAAGPAGQAGATGLAAIFSNPYSAAGAVGLGTAALPFAGQAVGTGLVGGLGAELLRFGITGASKLRVVKEQFKDLTATVNRSMKEIGRPLAPALDAILKAFGHTMRVLTPVFKTAMKDMAGPLKTFGTALAKAFAQPAVQHAIIAIAKAFGMMLKALSPAIGPAIGALATGITAVAKAVAKNPKSFADFITFLFKIAEGALLAIAWLTRVASNIEKFIGKVKGYLRSSGFDVIWHHIWDGMKISFQATWAYIKGALKFGLDWMSGEFRIVLDLIQGHWKKAWTDTKKLGSTLWHDIGNMLKAIWDALPGWLRRDLEKIAHETAVIFDGVRHEIAHVWDQIFQNTIGTVIRFGHDVERDFNNFRHRTAVIFDGVRHDIAHIWDMIWNNTIGRIMRGATDVGRGFRTVWNAIWNQIRHWPQWLWNMGKQILTMLWNGAKSMVSPIVNFFKSFANGIVHVFKSIWGWFSPSSAMYQGGKSLMEGLAKGIHDHAHKAQRAARNAATGAVSGMGVAPNGPVQMYAKRLLAAYGWGNQWGAFNDIVMRESGWNPLIQNPTSGAYGIPQALPGSKMASAGADWRTNPYTQLRWMMSYIRSRWVNPIGADYNERTQHWYRSGLIGGIFSRPTLIGVGEAGPEQVDVTPLGRGGRRIVLEIRSTGHSDFDRFMVSWLQRAVRTRGGGDVQVAFGGRS